MKIVEVGVRLTDKGWRVLTEEFEMEEKGKTYVGCGKRVAKTNLMVPRLGLMFHSHDQYRLYIWALPENTKEAVDIAVTEIKRVANKHNEEMKVIMDNIKNGTKEL